MTAYNWKILELTQTDGKVAKVKYRCEASTEKHKVATEGNWKFRKQYEYSENLTEHQVAHWLEMDTQEGDRHLIKTRLDEQLEALENAENCDPPWKVETFKVQL
jgi:hypothetical protein